MIHSKKTLASISVLALSAACAQGSGDPAASSGEDLGVVVELPHALGGGVRHTHLTPHVTPPKTYALGLKATPHKAPSGGGGAMFQDLQKVSLPPSVDVSMGAPSPGDQGPTGSCATWATGYSAMGWWDARTSLGGAPYAPMFLYAQQVHGNCDDGTMISDNLDIMKSQGMDTEADYEPMQHDLDCATQPSAKNRAAAAKYKISDYVTLDISSPQDAIMKELAAGHPIVLGVMVYDNFFNADGTNYLIGPPSPGDGLAGGHAITAFKYDKQGVWILNSWGTGWGKSGWGELSWDFVNGSAGGQPNVMDAEAITGVVGGSSPTPSPMPSPSDGGADPDSSAPDTGPPMPAPTGPSLKFASPNDGDTISPGDPISLVVDTTDASATITDVQLTWSAPSGDATFALGELGGGQYGIDLELSYYAPSGDRKLTVVVTDSNGNTATSVETLHVQ